MYKYDIPFPKENQYTLLFNGAPINVSKNASYLKKKMKAHRDSMGSEKSGSYEIKAPNGTTAYSRIYEKGEGGNSNVSYHVKQAKPVIEYRDVYLYGQTEPFTEVKREGEYPITTLEAICDADGAIVTDLRLLKLLSSARYYWRIPVIVTNKALVSMATYKPRSREEFVSLPGCGEKLYERCGERFISAIEEFNDKSESQE